MSGDFTRLLQAVAGGDRGAADDLYGLAYEELKQIARRQLRRGRPGETLQTTALVHEAWLKLFEHARTDPTDRAHFYALAARAMRQILVDTFRAGRAEKRGGDRYRLEFLEGDVPVEQRGEVLLAVDAALTRLAELEPRLSKVVECRFFGGMTQEETAVALGVSERTVRGDWRKARAFLTRELSEQE